MEKNCILSVCLIVKNEEKILKRCLKPVSEFADEIIIVDTGSTDKTVEIAKQFTPQVYNFTWNNNFSEARNYSFAKANGKYIMWLDADDVINNENVTKINQLKNHLTADTYMAKYKIMDKNNHIVMEFFRERIVKNCQNAKWNGFLHETITPFGVIEYTDFSITHQKQFGKDPKRNLKIYQHHIKNGTVLNTRELYYYSKELFYNQYYSKCITTLKKFLKAKNQFYANTLDATLTLSKCFELKNENQKALKTLLSALANISPTSEYVCEIGDIFLRLNNINMAITYYNFALTLPPQDTQGVFVNLDYYYFVPHIQLSVCYYTIKDYEKAKCHHNLAKQFNPNSEIVKNNDKFFTD